ncbi:PKD domain-containing protein [Chitinophaga defluvii]|uniref:T9SS type A sorting domain-containing protein n=1 Tax=Chitinophaga defluvii TaxID=3163343 RepID=A0ABV2T3Y7_9BACT
MKRLLPVLLSCLFAMALKAQNITYDTTIAGWNAIVTRDTNHFSKTDSLQGIIFIPGQGQVGTDPTKLRSYGPHYWMQHGWDGGVTLGNGVHYPIIISIQPPGNYTRPWILKSVIDAIMGKFRIKRNSLHFTGLSEGAWVLNEFITYMPVAGDYSYMSRVKSMVNMQGVVPTDTYGATLPYPQRYGHWAKQFGGRQLCMEQTGDTRSMGILVQNMLDSMPNAATHIYTTLDGNVGHCCWNTAYNPSATTWTTANSNVYSVPKGPAVPMNVWQWMLRNGDTTLSGPPANIPPVVNAGANQTITLPLDSVQLTGSATDADGTITGYSWTKQSGGTATISTPLAASTKVTGLAQGVYVFRLTATDNASASSYAQVTVTVNPASGGTGKSIKVNLYGGSNPYTTGGWNNWNTNASLNSGTLQYSDGASSSISLQYLEQTSIADNGVDYGGTMCPPEVLRYAAYVTVRNSLTIAGLDNTKAYDITLYASRKNTGNNTNFSINGDTINVVTDNNKTNAVVFTGINPTAGQIVVQSSRGTGGTYTYLNGLVITEQSSSGMLARSGTAASGAAIMEKKPGNNIDADITLSPNPAADQLNVRIMGKAAGPVRIRIYDGTGKVILTRQWTKNAAVISETISTDRLVSGLYFLEATIGNQHKTTQKFIKQ